MRLLKKAIIVIMTACFVMGAAACKEKTPAEKAADEAEKTVEKAKELFKD